MSRFLWLSKRMNKVIRSSILDSPYNIPRQILSKTTAVATPTFRDSADPNLGIKTAVLIKGSRSSEIPFDSFPKIMIALSGQEKL